MENVIVTLKRPIVYKGEKYPIVTIKLITIRDQLDSMRDAGDQTTLIAIETMKRHIESIETIEGKKLPIDEIDVDRVSSLYDTDYENLWSAVNLLKKTVELDIIVR